MSVTITRKDVVWNYLGTVMTLGSNLFILPFALTFLTGAELGLWYTFAAIGNIAILLDFGFKATMARNMTYAWCGANELQSFDAQAIDPGLPPNYGLMKRVMIVTRSIYLIISLVAVALLLTAGTMFLLHVGETMDVSIVIQAWLIYLVGVFFNMYYGYFNAFLTALGAIREANIANVVARFFQLAIALALLLLGFGLLAMAIGYCIFCIVFRLLASFFFFKYQSVGKILRNINDKMELAERFQLFRIIWRNAWRDGLVSLSSFLNSQATTLLCSWFLALDDTATYGLSMQLVNAIASVSAIYFSTYQSRMQELYIEARTNELQERLSSTLVVYAVVYMVGAIFTCVLCDPLLSIIGSNTRIDGALLVALFVYMFLYKNHTLYASYLAGTNRVIYTKAYVLSSALMVVLSIVLFEFTNIGIWTLAISPMLAECLFNVWYWPRYVLHELQMSIPDVCRMGFKRIRKDFGR